MTIANYTSRQEFGVTVDALLSPAQPVRSEKFLKGREQELKSIERALYAQGRHVFVYGDRGVGKSSLAATAAYKYQSPDAEPIFVAGSENDTFQTVVANIAHKALQRSKSETVKRQTGGGFNFYGLKWSAGQEINQVDIASRIQSIGDAALLLSEVGRAYSEKPIVVIDEFDTLGTLAERNKFASLLKQLGDQGADIKLIFTGIGNSLDDLLGAHPSAHRQLHQVELYRLGWEARLEIVEETVSFFGLTLDNVVKWRIPIVSDGFPYYVHLLTEQMLWAAFDDEHEVETLGPVHYLAGLQSAIFSINSQLKKPYEMAIMHRSEVIEDVLWSTADGENLDRDLADMYATYRWIAKERGRGELLEQTRFSAMVRRLKDPNYGGILAQVKHRPRWYTYTEKMLRGYVRIQAEANGIELTGDREAPQQTMHVGNARKGFYGSAVPRGVRFERRSPEDEGDGS